MKAEIWCEPNRLREPYCDGFKVWNGNLPSIPHKGDLIVVFDGFASEYVKDTTYMVYSDEPYVIITIGPDITGEYREKVK
jgi:hypothetical protein